jgi:diaminopimelate epimerase
MSLIKFTKMQGSGNDFVVVDQLAGFSVGRLKKKVPQICDRKYGVGADGVLLLEKSKKADARMRIFNVDGSEAEMCGNGARCAALFLSHQSKVKKLRLETKAGLIEAEVKGELVKIKLTDPSDLRLGLGISAAGKSYEVDYINTGVPHAVIAVDDLENVPVRELGRAIRHHEVFKPAGANVDFIKIIDSNNILVRTYERGVEDETLACGTGSVACAIIAVLDTCGESFFRLGGQHKVFVKTHSGEMLVVYFKASKKKITDVWLEGKAKIVYRGEYYV